MHAPKAQEAKSSPQAAASGHAELPVQQLLRSGQQGSPSVPLAAPPPAAGPMQTFRTPQAQPYQAMANQSPQVLQLKSYQEMANRSPQAGRSAAVHALAQMPVQMKRQGATEAEYLACGLGNAQDFAKSQGNYDASLAFGQGIQPQYEAWKQQAETERKDKKGTNETIRQKGYTTKTATHGLNTPDPDANVSLATGRLRHTPNPDPKVDPADDRKADYRNKFYPRKKKFVAAWNFRDSDSEQETNADGEPIKANTASNAEMIWHQYKQALAAAGLPKAAKKGNLIEIERETIINQPTKDTIFWSENGAFPSYAETAEITEGHPDFWALLGSENGRSAPILLLTHGVSMGVTRISRVIYGRNSLRIQYELKDQPVAAARKPPAKALPPIPPPRSQPGTQPPPGTGSAQNSNNDE
ncbi:MAG: hypothetical protein NW241_23235 [Bacteroidia bacterium]|nr:hypothetical protein [Bacteroidia bacterium]